MMTVTLVIFFFLPVLTHTHVLFVSCIDLLKVPPGFRVGMDFSSKGTTRFLTQKQQSKKKTTTI